MANLKKVKSLAEQKGISVRELAERVGLKENQIHVMSRTNSTKIDTLEKIAHELGVPVTVFFDDDVELVMEKKEFIHTGDHGTQAEHIDKVEVHDHRDTKKASPEKSEEAKPTYAELEAKVSDLQQRLLDAQSEIISLMKENRTKQ